MKNIFLVLLLVASCNKNNKSTDCPTDIMCTLEFRFLNVNVVKNGTPAKLDKYRTVRLSDNKEYNLQSGNNPWSDSTNQATGSYPLLSDSQQKEASTKGELFEFQGYQNGLMIVQKQFTIKDNCCHVELISGNTNVVLN